LDGPSNHAAWQLSIVYKGPTYKARIITIGVLQTAGNPHDFPARIA
ncbi:hypothetical protein HMPREF9080_00076, partial [Cardiobacterium valvarum F0432]